MKSRPCHEFRGRDMMQDHFGMEKKQQVHNKGIGYGTKAYGTTLCITAARVSVYSDGIIDAGGFKKGWRMWLMNISSSKPKLMLLDANMHFMLLRKLNASSEVLMLPSCYVHAPLEMKGFITTSSHTNTSNLSFYIMNHILIMRHGGFSRWVEAKVVHSEAESEKWRRFLLHQMCVAIDVATDGREEDFLPRNGK
ncbi:hypothetical protein Tco_0826047 [Tanacetum coccineum]